MSTPESKTGIKITEDAKITLHALDSDLRPVRAEADFMQFEKINKLEIELEKKLYMNLLFDPGHDLEERIINEQFSNS